MRNTQHPTLDSQLPKGYKQTEAGVVPVDWLDHTVGDLIEFEGGSQPDKSVFTSSWKPGYVRLIQIRDYKTDKYETYVPAHLARRFCTENDIMIGRYGPPIFQILRGLSGAYNVALIKATPRPQIDRSYAYYFLQQDKLFEFIDKLSQRSSGQTGVDLKELRAYPLPLPPTKAEQEAIAVALSDADALIESLEQLIAKKSQIKQGAMQELLTGKKRLPGFSGAWETKTLGDVAPLQRGFDLPNSKLQQGTYPVVYSNGALNYHTAFQVKGPGVVTGRSGTIGAVTFIEQNFWPHNTSLWVTTFKSNDPKFVFYLYTTIGLERFATGSGVPTLNRNDVHDFKVRIPPSTVEQIAIATILTDIDAEIAALEEKLAKAHQLKQGMMQELLTGKTRLVAREK